MSLTAPHYTCLSLSLCGDPFVGPHIMGIGLGRRPEGIPGDV